MTEMITLRGIANTAGHNPRLQASAAANHALAVLELICARAESANLQEKGQRGNRNAAGCT